MWMLTGDKVETAKCIAISTALKNPNQEFLTIEKLSDKQILERLLNEFGSNLANKKDQVLVIDGVSLATALCNSESLFFEVACKSKTVVCCRCSPLQKKEVTGGIKKYTGAKTLGIGDGGNDVAMIKEADIGVGIVGKEGKQAANSADFSIHKFKYLTD